MPNNSLSVTNQENYALHQLNRLMISNEIFPRLACYNLRSTSRFARTCAHLYGLFKPSLAESKSLLSSLLQHVARGEQEEASQLIQYYPYLLSHKGQVTDYSGRTFKHITAFQYALWARDRHMWEMILNHLPYDIAKQQLINLETEETEYGKCYDYCFYLKKYTDYNKNHLHWSPRESKQFWIGDIGRAQRQVPAHVAQEACNMTRLLYRTNRHWKDYCCNHFDERNLFRSLTLIDGTHYFPQAPGSGLGFEYAITFDRAGAEPESDNYAKAGVMKTMDGPMSPVFDEAFILCLFSSRNLEYTQLRKQFNIEGRFQVRYRYRLVF